MNRVSFQVEHEEVYGFGQCSNVNILVDNRLLSEIIKEIETPFAKQEGHPDLAGGYGHLDLPRSLQKYFLGEEEAYWGAEENKTTLLDCVCGCTGCWPLLCKIKVRGNQVTWSEFEQPHRVGDSGSLHWDYSSFEGFVFDKAEFIDELKSVEKSLIITIG